MIKIYCNLNLIELDILEDLLFVKLNFCLYLDIKSQYNYGIRIDDYRMY